ncbi:MAG: DASS family sodium-coupled anion symporter [Ferruginibacter sp.]|nr:DASS family sodium-coupled anion symporter [Ferruginibacter sp.]
MKEFFKNYKKEAALITGVLLCLFFFFVNPLALAFKAKLVLAIAALMISWWVLDAMPLAVVALVPIVLFPLLDVSSLKDVTKSYSDSIIFLFMGGFFIGIAIEKWNLHKRIALGIINITGTNGNRIILGFIIATGFLSMWLSNTATTMMMYPIAMSVIHVIATHNKQSTGIKNFSLVLMLSIAYASNFALGTIIGTPPNVAYVNYIHEKFNYTIGFTDWMIVFIPLTIVLFFVLYWVLVKFLFPNKIKHSVEGKSYIRSELKALGKLSAPEKRVLLVFTCTVFLWILKDVINLVQKMIVLDDTIIAMIGAIALFIIPSGNKKEEREERLLAWTDTTKMAWGILLLFGGGIALAKALEDVKLMDQLGAYIASYATDNVFLMILIVTTISIFLSEVMSNVAQVIVMAPVISSVAVALHMDPLLLGIPMTLAASCASMLPMGTPPNAIVFASGYIKMKDMLKAGFVLNIICIFLITLFCWLLQPMIMKLV